MKTFEELQDFIQNKMRMSHIYQPVLLSKLIQSGGVCHEGEIAKALLSYDISQIDYYKTITNNMVGKVLRNHKIVERDNKTKNYSLCTGDLSNEQKEKLLDLCQEKITEFLEKRGDSVFEHRKKSSGYVSGTIRYEVLKRAKFRCELCGISAEQKALEVDHILPRSKGGSDELSNFQALCYSCNAMKRDRDDADFRGIKDMYGQRDQECLFCKKQKGGEVIAENELAYVVRDGFPVTELHTLIIPKRHIESYFDLGQAEINAVNELLKSAKSEIEELDQLVTGFNVGINSGESAGQTIFHCHIHLIPRRDGDVDTPKGGVRHLIPGMGTY